MSKMGREKNKIRPSSCLGKSLWESYLSSSEFHVYWPIVLLLLQRELNRVITHAYCEANSAAEFLAKLGACWIFRPLQFVGTATAWYRFSAGCGQFGDCVPALVLDCVWRVASFFVF